MGRRPEVLPPELTAERISEIQDLLTNESSISFYSSRAHESMWLLVAEVERLKTALNALATERNTWARQLADMADERQTALDEASVARTGRAGAQNERDVLTVRLDEVRDFARSLLLHHPYAAAQLLAVLDHQTTDDHREG